MNTEQKKVTDSRTVASDYPTFAELGEIMLREAGAQACRSGYGTTDPEWVGRYAVEYGDICSDGTLN